MGKMSKSQGGEIILKPAVPSVGPPGTPIGAPWGLFGGPPLFYCVFAFLRFWVFVFVVVVVLVVVMVVVVAVAVAVVAVPVTG